MPPPFDAIRERVITSDEVFEVEDLPKSLIARGAPVPLAPPQRFFAMKPSIVS